MTDYRPTSDAQTLWYRLEVAARVIKEFKPETKSLELARFLLDIRAAVDGDLLEDEDTGKLMRFAPGQGRLLTALLSSQEAEESAERDAAKPGYFVAPDGHDNAFIWSGTGEDDPNCRAITSKGRLDSEHPVLWPTLVKALTGQDPAGPRVVTICGSMRFFDDMLKVAEEETAAGRIVLAPFSVVAPEDQGGEFKQMLDDLHRRKIDLASEIIVVTRDGYIGESTRGEIEYAREHGKTARYVEAGDNEGCGGPGCVSFGGCAVCAPEAVMEQAHAAGAHDILDRHFAQIHTDDTPGGAR